MLHAMGKSIILSETRGDQFALANLLKIGWKSTVFIDISVF